MDYTWKHRKGVTCDQGDNFDLLATTEDEISIYLRRFKISEAAEMLGIWMSPNNDESILINELKTKAMQWGAKVRQGNANQF